MEKSKLLFQIAELHNLGLKDSQIATQLSENKNRIYHYRHKVLKLPNNNNYTINKYKDDILKMWAEDYTLKEICDKFKISFERLHNFLKNENLSTRGKVGNRKKIKRNIGPREKGILLGMFLGDGTIYKNKTVKYKNGMLRFAVRHCFVQREYCNYIYNSLKHLNSKIKIVNVKGHVYNDKVFKPTKQVEVRLTDNTFLNDLYNYGYNNEKKTIPFDLLHLYNREALAFHFMDDGSKAVDTNGNIVGFILCTDGFSYDEVLKFSYFLKGKFNIDTTIRTTNEKHHRIYIVKKSVNRFIYLIKPYIIDSMKYKICPNKTL